MHLVEYIHKHISSTNETLAKMTKIVRLYICELTVNDLDNLLI
jgi:hypothetical protein